MALSGVRIALYTPIPTTLTTAANDIMTSRVDCECELVRTRSLDTPPWSNSQGLQSCTTVQHSQSSQTANIRRGHNNAPCIRTRACVSVVVLQYKLLVGQRHAGSSLSKQSQCPCARHFSTDRKRKPTHILIRELLHVQMSSTSLQK